VVIAIIAILAGLLLPALASAKQKALRTQCVSQNKQLGLAVIMYAGDFEDYVVWPNWGTANVGWLYKYSGGIPQPSAPGVDHAIPYTGGLLWTYINKSYKVYQCPADNTNLPSWAARAEKLSTYVMNGAPMAYHPTPVLGYPTHKLGEMNPSAYMFWEPDATNTTAAAATYNDGANQPDQLDGPSTRHGNGCVVTGFDGHAQFLNIVTFTTELVNKGSSPTYCWADPDSVDGGGYNTSTTGNGCTLPR